MFHVMVRGKEARVLTQRDANKERLALMAGDGWKLVWNQAPSRRIGYDYAWMEYGALGPAGVAR